MDDVRRELKRGTLELVLLALLAEEDRYGYDIVATLEARGGPAFRIKEGTLYPVLYRLEDRGDIQSYRDNPKRGVPRKYYHLTEGGAIRLNELRTEWRSFVEIVDRFLHPPPGDAPSNPASAPRGDPQVPNPAPASAGTADDTGSDAEQDANTDQQDTGKAGEPGRMA